MCIWIGEEWEFLICLNPPNIYICPKCNIDLKDVYNLICHLRNVHVLFYGQDYTIVCSQNFCQQTYHNSNFYASTLTYTILTIPNAQDTNSPCQWWDLWELIWTFHTTVSTTINNVRQNLLQKYINLPIPPSRMCKERLLAWKSYSAGYWIRCKRKLYLYLRVITYPLMTWLSKVWWSNLKVKGICFKKLIPIIKWLNTFQTICPLCNQRKYSLDTGVTLE